MFVIIPGRKKLNKEVVSNITNRQLTKDELVRVYNFVKEEYTVSNKGFKRAVIIVLVIYIMMIGLSLPMIIRRGILPFLSSFFLLSLTLPLILAFVKIFYVDNMKKQFIRAVKTGYPDMMILFNFDIRNNI